MSTSDVGTKTESCKPDKFYGRVTKDFISQRTSPRRIGPKSRAPIVISDDSEPVNADDVFEPELEDYIPPDRADNGSYRPCHITCQELQCLQHKKSCLNDAVINAYISHLSRLHNINGRIGFTNTYWLPKLRRDGFDAAMNWEGIWGKRLDVYEKFLIPVATGCHWILIEICFGNFVINVYDSLGKSGTSFVNSVKDFMKKQGIVRKFVTSFPKVPKQTNTYDCGVFLLLFAECIFLNIGIEKDTFQQRDMLDFRSKILGNLLDYTC